MAAFLMKHRSHDKKCKVDFILNKFTNNLSFSLRKLFIKFTYKFAKPVNQIFQSRNLKIVFHFGFAHHFNTKYVIPKF